VPVPRHLDKLREGMTPREDVAYYSGKIREQQALHLNRRSGPACRRNRGSGQEQIPPTSRFIPASLG
jgi:hypothetical protein